MARRKPWLIGAGLLGAVLFGPGLVQWVRLSIEERRLDRRLAAIQVARERLTKERDRIQSDPAYTEGLIRSTFKMAKPGEYVIPLDPEPAAARQQ